MIDIVLFQIDLYPLTQVTSTGKGNTQMFLRLLGKEIKVILLFMDEKIIRTSSRGICCHGGSEDNKQRLGTHWGCCVFAVSTDPASNYFLCLQSIFEISMYKLAEFKSQLLDLY